jgi:hypothetical protein
MYFHSIYDNGSGNTTGISRAQSYTTVFRDLRGACSKHFDKVGCPVDQNSTTALWILQLVHQAKMKILSQKTSYFYRQFLYATHNGKASELHYG